MRETLRRVVAAFCLYAGIALCLTPDHHLLEVEPVNWQQKVGAEQQHSENVKGIMEPYVGHDMLKDVDLASETRGTIAEYIAQETEGRLITVSGADWEGLWNDIAATVTDQAPSESWAATRGLDYRADAVYLPTTAPLLQQLTRQWPEDSLLSYVRITPENSEIPPRYLSVYQASPMDLREGAPTHLVYPYRTFGAMLLLAGLLFYILLPHAPPPESGVFYLAQAVGWLPDLLAALGSGCFFAMPFLITADAAGGPFDPGWWPLTVVMWFIGAIFASIFVITTWYQTRHLTWDDSGISITTWGFSRRDIRRDELEMIDVYVQQMPRWLRVLAWIISIFNWRATSSAILLEQTDPGFSILLTNGTRFSFTGDGMWGGSSFLAWSDSQGIPVNPGVRPLLESHADYSPSRAGRVVSIIFAVLILIGAGWPLTKFAMASLPQPQPEFRTGSFSEQSDLAPPSPAPQQPAAGQQPVEQPMTEKQPEKPVTPEMLAREREIMKEIAAIRDELKVLQKEIGTISNPNAVAIEKTQQAMKRLAELQKEFEAVRSGKTPVEQSPEPKSPQEN